MKKTIIVICCFLMPFLLMAQEEQQKTQKEVGLIFSNLDNFGLSYKVGTSESLWRFNTLFIDGNNLSTSSDDYINDRGKMAVQLKVGKEFRKKMNPKLNFRYGADLSFAYSQSTSDLEDKTTINNDQFIEQILYEPGLNLVLGFNYSLNENIIIGAELMPHFTYVTGTTTQTVDNTIGYGETTESEISGFSYGLSNNSVLLSIVYQFQNKK